MIQRAIDAPEVLLAPEVSLRPAPLPGVLPEPIALDVPAKLTERHVLVLSAPMRSSRQGSHHGIDRCLACREDRVATFTPAAERCAPDGASASMNAANALARS